MLLATLGSEGVADDDSFLTIVIMSLIYKLASLMASRFLFYSLRTLW